MKKLKFTCPHCEAKLRVPTHLAGVSAPCPKCGSVVTAPTDITEAVFDTQEPRRPSRPRVEQPVSSRPAAAPSRSATAVLEAPASRPASPAPHRVSAPAAERLPVETPKPLRPEVVQRAPQPEPELPPPSFFVPPPPIQPMASPNLVEDERSEAPVPLDDDASIVVEEQCFAESSALPPSQITQPIQVVKHRDELPTGRTVVSGVGNLPRLDISLGAQAGMAASIPTSEIPAPAARTRVVLPAPGAEVSLRRPEDFLAPPIGADLELATIFPPVPEPAPESEIDAASAEAMDEDVASAFDFFEPLPLPEPEAKYTTVPIPAEDEPMPLDDLDFEDLEESYADDDAELESFAPPLDDAEPELELPEAADADAAPEFIPLPSSLPDPPSAPAVESWSPVETASVPLNSALAGTVVRREPSTVTEEFGENGESLYQDSFGNLLAQQAPVPGPPPVPEIRRRQERDVLDELFSDDDHVDDDPKAAKKTLIAMAVIFVGVLVLAIVGVAFAIKVLGGTNPAADYIETVEPGADGPKPSVPKPKIPTSKQTEGTEIEDAPAVLDPVAVRKEPVDAEAVTQPDAPALSFDERVQQAVEGKAPAARGGSVIGGTPRLDLVEPSSPPATPPVGNAAPAPAPQEKAAPTAAVDPQSQPEAATPPATAVTPMAAQAAATAKDPNYHPQDSFPAPGADDSKLGKTHDLIDAFLRAPDVQTRLKYTYNGDSLGPAIEDYHKKWPYHRFDRYSLQLYQMETDVELGGPYWVYIVSTSDTEQGFPLIVRTENGLLKADWEIFSEFSDRHFLRFRQGTMPPPATFRLIIERASDYYGSDREAFKDIDDYLIYQVSPPYGDLNEFTESVFVKKGTDLAKALDKLVPLGEEPLAVVVTLDQKAFGHGIKHIVITDLVTEGWFR